MSLYPVFLKLEGRKVLIVGGGLIAEEKAASVLRSRAAVTVVSADATTRIRTWARGGLLRHQAEPYRAGMVHDYFLVIACTESEAVNRAVASEASAGHVLCNVVDDPDYCDFY